MSKHIRVDGKLLHLNKRYSNLKQKHCLIDSRWIMILQKSTGQLRIRPQEVCGRALVHSKVTIEHYIPKYHGGTDDERNLLPLCKNCNKSKGSRIVRVEEHYPFLKAVYCTEVNKYRTEWENGGEGNGNSKGK